MKVSGITLIALVVTIVVLIILATVSINAVFDENGIIKQAENAKKHQANAVASDEEAMNDLQEQYDIAMGNKGPNGIISVTKLTGIQTETTVSEDRNGIKVTVPAGFKVRADLVVAADEGIVVEDEEGNQFVWVPCTTTGEEGKVAYAQDKQYNDGTTASKQYNYNSYSDWTDTGDADSVAEHGGFYVARYEAGVPSNADFYVDASSASSDGATYKVAADKNVTTYTPVSKANNQSWNYISQTNAKTVSENMYKDSTSVTSKLIDSYAWDTIVNWMEADEKYEGIALDSTKHGNYEDSSSSITVKNTLYALHTYNAAKTDSGKTSYWTPAIKYEQGYVKLGGESTTSSDENYTSTIRKEIATGSTDMTRVKNIYDMAGNMWEWTTETGYHDEGSSGTQYAVLRGGSFHNDKIDHHPISSRSGSGKTSGAVINLGFRVVLYVK